MVMFRMGELTFIGLGLHDELDISIRGLNVVKESDFVFAEFYTSLMPGFSTERFERMIGRKIRILSRRDLRDILSAFMSEKRIDRLYDRLRFLIDTIFP